MVKSDILQCTVHLARKIDAVGQTWERV